MSSFYKCVPKITIIWCMLHEIWSATDKYFCHFGPFFSLTTWRIKILKKWNKHIHVYHKWRWFLRCKMQPTVFFVILDHFLLFYLPNNLKNQNFEEMKKPPVKMSLFHKYVPKITVIWCMLHKIWSATDKYFCHFGHFFDLTTWKIKIFKKWKKHVYHIWRWFLRCKMQPTLCFVTLDHFLSFYLPDIPKNQNFEKMEHLEILSVHTCVP